MKIKKRNKKKKHKPLPDWCTAVGSSRPWRPARRFSRHISAILRRS